MGSLRWLPPQPPAQLKGTFQATQPGNVCTQPNGPGRTIGSEDCLTLNVYVPDVEPPEDGFPVMVWIHGGGLVTGSGSGYDPTPIVEKGNVIVVTINYRLGYLGFFGHPAIEAENHLKANYGLMDQQFALKWVKRNIKAFGGDDKQLTIFGESAGGQSVLANLASPAAAGLFRRAISESGAGAHFQDEVSGRQRRGADDHVENVQVDQEILPQLALGLQAVRREQLVQVRERLPQTGPARHLCGLLTVHLSSPSAWFAGTSRCTWPVHPSPG